MSTPAHRAPHKHRLTRRAKVITAGLALGLAFAGSAAFAAWILNTGTGNVTVASSNWTISLAAPTGGPLAPTGSSYGNSTESIAVTFLQTGQAAVTFNGATATMTEDAGGGVYDTLTDAYVDGCPAADFTNNMSLQTNDNGTQYNPGNHFVLTMTITISASAPTACEGLAPQITVTAT
ncbi:MAG: hypothetical protein ACLP50_32200 [Solirubrobacteraceae bacterium]